MNQSDAKKLRNLTWAYLKRPDPFNWLVAADLLEENGLDEESQKWRWRGSAFEALRYAVQTAKEMARDSRWHSGSAFYCLISCQGKGLLGFCFPGYHSVRIAVGTEKLGELARGTRYFYCPGEGSDQEDQTKAMITIIDHVREQLKTHKGVL